MNSKKKITMFIVMIMLFVLPVIPAYAAPIPPGEPIPDSDGDGIFDSDDNCPLVYNPDQADSEMIWDCSPNQATCQPTPKPDGIGDVCDDCPTKPESFNGYKDEDGCPDTVLVTLSINKLPENPVLGDRVTYKVQASDPEGIAVIQIFINGTKMRTCFSSSCEYTTPPTEGDPLVGVLAANENGELLTEGSVPDDAVHDVLKIKGDVDQDGIGDLKDNCVGTYNPDQSDIDHDGVGDECDACCPACDEALTAFAEYCCLPHYGAYYRRYDIDSCRDEVSRLYGKEDVYYWEDIYGSVVSNGCGCYDYDGDDIFSNGFVVAEEIDSGITKQEYQLAFRRVGWNKSICSQEIDVCVDVNGNVVESGDYIKEFTVSSQGNLDSS